jgi:hypothetical protein
MKKSNDVYLNEKQIAFLQARQKLKVLIAGRGFGKSRVIGHGHIQKIKYLPRSKGFLSSTTYAQILTKTLAPIEESWQSVGLKEYRSAADPGHYVIGRKPPSSFMTPWSAPKKYDNIITFWNGTTIELLSMDRPDLARGGSYDWGDVDESLLVAKEHIDRVLIPSLRGNSLRFKAEYRYLLFQLNLFGSMPFKASGMYLLDYEQKAKEFPKEYFYLEGTAYDNIHVLTEEGIERMRKEMDPLIFAIEIMNKRSGRSSHAFYHAFNDDYHCYTPNYLYGHGESGITVIGSNDRDKTAVLETSWDFGGWFKCCTVYQEKNGVESMIGSFHRKEKDSVDAVVDDFCIEYADHKYKKVKIWGEPHGFDILSIGASNYDRIEARFKQNGWEAIICVTSAKSDFHEVRYEYINDILMETNPRLPKLRINQDKCKAVIISLNNADVTIDGKKDKKDERNKSFKQEHATHYTDTVDYYFVQKYKRRSDEGRHLPGRGSGRVSM